MNSLVKHREQSPWLRDFLDVENIFGNNWFGGTSLPAVNISEDEKCYALEVVAPGFKKEDFKVKIDDDVLTISAESKTEHEEEDKKRQFNRREYSYNSFTRSFRLPDNAKDDGVDAKYKDGILKLEIPKTKSPVKATKEVQIS
jgi:HSP20 family protein